MHMLKTLLNMLKTSLFFFLKIKHFTTNNFNFLFLNINLFIFCQYDNILQSISIYNILIILNIISQANFAELNLNFS